MKKEFLATILALCLVLGLMPGEAWAADIVSSGSCGENATWTQYSDGTLVISGTGVMKNYSVIPLPDSPWSMNSSIKTVKIEEGIVNIGSCAFGWMFGLTTVEIPKSVVVIGGDAFNNSRMITKINYAGTESDWDKIEISSGNYMLSKDKIQFGSGDSSDKSGTCGPQLNWNLSEDGTLTISGIGEMDDFAGGGEKVSPWYAYRKSIKKVIVENGVTSTGYCAFWECTDMTSISLPNTLTKIGDFSFGLCTSLKEIDIPISVTQIEFSAFCACYALTSITIPDRVTKIEGQTFSECTGLKRITIPSGVVSIGDSAFWNCPDLMDVYYGGSQDSWKNVHIGNDNEPLTSAKIYCNGGSDAEISNKDISKIEIGEKNIQSLFIKSSFDYDNDLAIFAANLSKAAEDQTGDNMLNYYRSLEWPDDDREIYQYSGDRAYSIACAKLSKDENLLVITARGSQTLSEFFEDGFSFGHRDFFGYTTNDVIDDFERDIMTGLNEFLTNHKYLMKENLKILITGHSLGGAAANLNAARFTMFEDSGAWWSDLTEQSDIYCYTFGAINSLSDNSTEKRGFENIHNIYNLLDSFGPYRCGNSLPSGLGRGYGKFGHMEMYAHNYETGLYVPILDSTNHLIENYIDSLNNGYVSCRANTPLGIYGGGGWCPIDLKIYLETTDGPVLVGSITDNQIDYVEHPMVGLRVEGDKKYFYLPDDGNYTIKLECTDSGTMTYFVQEMNAETGEQIDGTGIVYQQVQLAAGKQFYSDIKIAGDTVSGIRTEKVPLYVLNDTGTPEKEVLPNGKGTEVPIDTPTTTYTITYNATGGTVTPDTATTNDGDTLSTLPTPTRDGYTFDGWYTAADGGEKVDESRIYTENTTLYAHWTPSSVQPGDLNGDGKVTMADVIRLARGAAGYVTLTGQEQKAGDVTGDGKITMADVIRVARYAAGYSTSL